MRTLTRNVVENWGADGERWLADLPALIAEVAAEWGVRVLRTYPMTFHWVAEAERADGTGAVLKLGVPDGHLDTEAEALRVFDGEGAVWLLAENAAKGALLIERAEPGTPLTVDDEATLVEVGRRLHRVRGKNSDLPHLRNLRGGFERYREGPIPRRMVDRAAELFDDLCDSATRETVLHGDLHHGNVLRGRDGEWLAIDPHGWVGDPGYDGGAMLYNPDPERRDPELLELVPRRIEMLAAYEKKERVIAWGYVMGVLSELWTVESSGQARTRALDVARFLEPMLD
ncbi:aminoglycoside phosphotransferase family protein [Paractinoplanes brasiliensis]|uniref:Streptomycin 6-kinase n=1 Tax=Paractinoplanes brasiliensis TaxID=52695 RepID=A0A4R6JNE5_9ACTN|nr:aminoglycoside phosphotransferase family protein [Actinoplanes brasiliensis]TDO37890.1 streptomycin 6-kinase [Actinoplanes brasiliensis]GID32971.1 hydroxyurea phosphotransferase [Actinoplanes brasiliensis]